MPAYIQLDHVYGLDGFDLNMSRFPPPSGKRAVCITATSSEEEEEEGKHLPWKSVSDMQDIVQIDTSILQSISAGSIDIHTHTHIIAKPKIPWIAA
jgi:hypothetical protein